MLFMVQKSHQSAGVGQRARAKAAKLAKGIGEALIPFLYTLILGVLGVLGASPQRVSQPPPPAPNLRKRQGTGALQERKRPAKSTRIRRLLSLAVQRRRGQKTYG